jgi:hypothetical protein
MTNQDVKKFAEIMAYLGTIFSKDLTSTGIKMYFKTLIDLDIADIEKAALHMANCRTITGTFPLPSEFREAIQNADGSPDERAEIAWSKLMYAFERLSYMDSVTWDDLHICDTVQALGGWLLVTSADGDIHNEDWLTKNLTWRKKDFLAMYKAVSKRQPVLQYLPGLQELENKGKHPDFMPKICLIGGQPGALQVGYADARYLPGPEQDKVDALIEKVLQ